MSKGTLKEGPDVSFVPLVPRNYGYDMKINGYPLDIAELMLSDEGLRTYIGKRLGITLEMMNFSDVESFSGYPLVRKYLNDL